MGLGRAQRKVSPPEIKFGNSDQQLRKKRY